MARVFKRETSPHYYAQWYDEEGRRQQRTTKCTERRAAQAQAEKWERQAHDPAYSAANQATVFGALEEFVGYLRELVESKKRAAGTLHMHKTKAGHLLRVFGSDTPLSSVTATSVDDYISSRRSEGAAEATINKELITLRSTLKHAQRRGLWKKDLAEVMPVSFAPEYKPRARYLTQEEVQKLLPNLTALHAARTAFMIATGANAGEATRAQRGDVDGNLVFLRGTKRTSRRRTVPVMLDHHLSLLEYSLQHAAADTLFPGRMDAFNKALAAGCRDAGIPHACPNDLRRTFAQWMRQAGVPPELIGPAMGHADTRMVERVYGRMATDVLAARIAQAASGYCSNSAADSAISSGFTGHKAQGESPKSAKRVPRAGVEPARDYSQGILSPIAMWPNPRKTKRNRDYSIGSAAIVQLEDRSQILRVVGARARIAPKT